MFARRGSNDPMSILVVLGIFGVFIAIAIIQSIIDKKRREAIKSYCRLHGLNYNETASNVPSIARSFSLLEEKGHSNRWETEMFGKRGEYFFSIFEHYYVVGYGKHKQTYKFTICTLSKSGVNMPQFFVRDESLIFDSLGKLFGGQDINFTEDPVFSRKFVLQGMIEPSIREFFDKRVRTAFVDHHITGYQYEGFRDCFAVSVKGSLDINERLALLSNSMAVFKNIVPREEQEYLS